MREAIGGCPQIPKEGRNEQRAEEACGTACFPTICVGSAYPLHILLLLKESDLECTELKEKQRTGVVATLSLYPARRRLLLSQWSTNGKVIPELASSWKAGKHQASARYHFSKWS